MSSISIHHKAPRNYPQQFYPPPPGYQNYGPPPGYDYPPDGGYEYDYYDFDPSFDSMNEAPRTDLNNELAVTDFANHIVDDHKAMPDYGFEDDYIIDEVEIRGCLKTSNF